MPKTIIRCPKCYWEPDDTCIWMCDVCKTRWNTFATSAECPGCGKVFIETACLPRKGGCGQMSLHVDWYETVEDTPNQTPGRSIWFWKNRDLPPVTENDRKWIEQSLVFLAGIFEPIYFKTLSTITPDKQYFDRDFTGTEADAAYIFERLVTIMHINAWEIRLMFSAGKHTSVIDNIVATPSGGLQESWSGSSSKYVNNGLGHKEIWLDTSLLKDSIKLIATLSHELAHYKLLGEYRMEENDELLTDLTAVAFGFGIFKGNSYFKFSQWTSNSRQGWQMQKNGYLPEQVIAYAMAWLAHYRKEDVSWKKYLNKTMRKYFEQSYRYIEKNRDKVIGG